MRRLVSLGMAVIGLAALHPAGSAAVCPAPAAPASAPAWPPPPETGAFDIAHFGEGHWNEGQGPLTMPLVVQELIAYAPDLVAFSSDMADTGTPEPLGCFKQLMAPLAGAGIPWYDSPGNHDRTPLAGPGGVLSYGIEPYRQVFADMPAPWGDGPVPAGVTIPEGEADDGPGAATHYVVDYANVRLIVMDNSRQSFVASDLDQYPPVGLGALDAGQLAFLARAASEASDRVVLVVMHQPTQDPRDITNVYPISYNHTMNKGATPDNALFDVIAAATGVDGVLLGHIQGNVAYRFADTRYFIDGGGGGSPYALREVGTDTGYYYGFRILRVTDDGFRTYFVPLVDRIELSGPSATSVGSEVSLSATAVQPFDPSLPARFGLLSNEQIRLELRPPDPSRIDAATVPRLAYMWTTSDSSVLAPVPGPDDPAGDPAFDPATMTTSGRFVAKGAGTATLTVATGTHTAATAVAVS